MEVYQMMFALCYGPCTYCFQKTWNVVDSLKTVHPAKNEEDNLMFHPNPEAHQINDSSYQQIGVS